MLLFAYGSNMLTARISERTPSARAVSSGKLVGYTLKWNKRSKDGSGKCNATETGRPVDVVWGVAFELDVTDKMKIDELEGLGRGYGERTAKIVTENGLIRAELYYATSIDLTVRPYDWYKDLVIAGAREHGLPEEYIETLVAVEVVTDPDQKRAERNRALLGSQPRSLD